jgi:hypothetical protein
MSKFPIWIKKKKLSFWNWFCFITFFAGTIFTYWLIFASLIIWVIVILSNNFVNFVNDDCMVEKAER